MKRAPQSAVGARASKMSSLQLGPARIPDSGRGDGAELLVTLALAPSPGRPRETPAGGQGLRAASGGFAGGSVPPGSVCPERPLRSTRLPPQLGGGGAKTHIGVGDGCTHSRQQPESLGKHAVQGLSGRRA